MSLLGVHTIEKVKFVVGSAAKEYYVYKVLIKGQPEGIRVKLSNRSYSKKIAGYHLSIVVFAEDVVQDSGTAEDFISLQAEIEDNSTSVFFYPDATQSENYEVIISNLKERTLLETDFSARIDSDVIRCSTKSLVNKSNIEWYKKF